MAKGQPPNKPVPPQHEYDVNFVTGPVDTTATPIYQIKVFKSGDSTINIVAGTQFGITDWDATDGNPGEITLEAGKYYNVYAQIRSKPGTSAAWHSVGLTKDVRPKDEWAYIGLIYITAGVQATTFTNDITSDGIENGCSNFATRWVEVID